LVQTKKIKNNKSQLLLEDLVKHVPIRRRKRTTLSVYRGRGGKDESTPVVKK
jgi:hypothetical protein